MKRHRSFPLVFVLVFLATSSIISFQPVKAQFFGSITINADGSVSPSTAPIQRVSTVYSLISDVVGNIIVHTSNIILDGNGHTISGVSLQETLNVTAKNFLVLSQGERIGISLSDASNNRIINNTVQGFWSIYALNGILFAGIHVGGGNSNVISQNNLEYNLVGLDFLNTSYNLIVQNNITSNSLWSPYTTGIYFVGASNNTVYHNNFVNSTYQAQNANSVNIWDNGYSDGGNYWGDYSIRYYNAAEIDKSGIGDTPYVIDSQNKDRYPLMEPFNETFYVQKTTPPKISLLSPLNQTYNDSTVPLVFNVDKQANWTGYSLDGKQNVTLNINSTIANLTQDSHTIVVYANYTFGIVGASETVTFAIVLPSPSPSPSPSPTPSASQQQPTSSPQPQTSTYQTELIYATAATAVAVVVISAAVFVIKKRKSSKIPSFAST